MGKTNHPLFVTWRGMVNRCTYKSDTSWKRYGGRGIKVCDRWKESFQNFVDDMGERPQGMSLDRIDNNGDYCPENCRWADKKTQRSNMRSNHFLEFRGERLTLTQWAERLGTSFETLYQRKKRGLPVEVILSGKRLIRSSRTPCGLAAGFDDITFARFGLAPEVAYAS